MKQILLHWYNVTDIGKEGADLCFRLRGWQRDTTMFLPLIT